MPQRKALINGDLFGFIIERTVVNDLNDQSGQARADVPADVEKGGAALLALSR